MYVGDEKTEISEISFSSDSGVGNIANAKQVAIVLDKTTANAGDNKLTLSGYATPIEEARENIKKGNTYNMKFYDVSTDEMKEVPCTVTVFQDGVGESIPCTLECNTASKPIETYVGNLTQASIDEDKVFYLTVNPDLSSQPPNTLLTPSGSSSGGRTFYRKDSSGLSGGAIAGIVIACVVVLAAASIAAIMLRKPAPPVDNTTVVGLKTVENI
jgi:hypothetical protein